MAEIKGNRFVFVILCAYAVWSMGLGELSEEPKCLSKFDYDYKLLHLVVNLEKQLELVTSTTEGLKIQVENIVNTYQGQMSTLSEKVDGGTFNIEVIEEKLQSISNQLQEHSNDIARIPRWNQWTEWSGCKLNCTGPSGGRLQTRSRTARTSIMSGSNIVPTNQSESRPCNAVQFAGCVKSSGSDDDEYAIVYDYPDMLAQATCTALGNGYILAIRRSCKLNSPSCLDVCKAVGTKCVNALHVYDGTPVPKRGETGNKLLLMYRYNICTWTTCGPNFCCCDGN